MAQITEYGRSTGRRGQEPRSRDELNLSERVEAVEEELRALRQRTDALEAALARLPRITKGRPGEFDTLELPAGLRVMLGRTGLTEATLRSLIGELRR